jgi:hypothetical protein
MHEEVSGDIHHCQSKTCKVLVRMSMQRRKQNIQETYIVQTCFHGFYEKNVH